MLEARARRTFVFAALVAATGCTLFVDLDRYDRGGPKPTDAARDVVVDVRIDFDARFDAPTFPEFDGAPPDAPAGCTCAALAECCKAIVDPYERDFCEREWGMRQPDDGACCGPLIFFRSSSRCP